ncbi:Uncharacterised protein [Legionella wadsworthii]|uniref:Uncharacterized protein n=1 Tax=Legionella wadsworthii TaxID=28088 RepID=A0A378LUD8_9GAMM|nr:hypothetical protein [Legionella wadsworthii]STY30793.1 Uncharacterised protein [Legionella wadsworthii]
MFFKEQIQEINRVVNNLRAQQDLLERQLKDGSISKDQWQQEQKRLAQLTNAYTNNLISAVQEEKDEISNLKFSK